MFTHSEESTGCLARAGGRWGGGEREAGICRGEDRGLRLPPSMLCRTNLRAPHGAGRELLWGSFVRAVSDVYSSPLSLQAHTPRCLDGLYEIGCGPGPQLRPGHSQAGSVSQRGAALGIRREARVSLSPH